MTGLYLSDNEEKGTVPRIKYTPSCGEITSTIPKSIYQRPPQQRSQQQRGRAGSLDYDSDSSSSPQIEHKDLKSRMRALMEAANGKTNDTSQNDADKYVNNRAKLREKQQEKTDTVQSATENKPKSLNLNARRSDEKVDRKAAMAKISQTFGYGEGPKVTPAPLLTAKERQAERKLQEKPKQSKLVKQNTSPDLLDIRKRHQEKNSKNSTVKNKPASVETPSNKKCVEKWDFKPTPPKNGGGLIDLDSSIDPELDLMLAELEMDEDFKKLGDNDQMTWYELLNYQKLVVFEHYEITFALFT